MKCIKFVLLLMAIFHSYNMSSQIVEPIMDPMNFRIRVKQVEEFMRRFNFEEANELFEVEKDSVRRRELNLTGLFDFELIKNRPDEVQNFVMAMLDNNVKLAFTDSTWRAVAHCDAIYQGKQTVITLVLCTERIEQNMYKWVIKDALGDVLKLKPQKINPGLKISPTDNEVNFMSLNHVTDVEAKNILNYKANGREIDELSVFLALVYQGILRIQHVKELEYMFDVPHQYEFTVRQFKREALNSGWLISDFKKKNNYED